MDSPIYLDHHATTPLDSRVLDAMMPYLTTNFGNASSRGHSYGWHARVAVDSARERTALAIGATPDDIVFTSGATESANIAIQGIARSYRSIGDTIITVATEHPAVLDTCAALETDGFTVIRLGVDSDGLIDIEDLSRAIDDRTILVAVMHANNEIGTIQEIDRIGAVCRERRVIFFTDATQSVGRIPFDVIRMNVDLAAFSAHKFYGPKGCGALYVRRRGRPGVRLTPIIHGGGHEGGTRSGTLNVPGIVGMARALDISMELMSEESQRITGLRDRLWKGLCEGIEDITLNGPNPIKDAEHRLPGNLNVAFNGLNADTLMMDMKSIAISTGSACASASDRPSHVLKAIDPTGNRGRSSLRFGLGRSTSEREIDLALQVSIAVASHIRRSNTA